MTEQRPHGYAVEGGNVPWQDYVSMRDRAKNAEEHARELDARLGTTLQDLTYVKSKLAAYEKMLEMYADKTNWACGNTYMWHQCSDDKCTFDDFDVPFGYRHGYEPAREVLGLDKERQLECLDCKHVWTAPWSLETKCPKCGRGFTLPEDEQENGNAEDHNHY